MSIRLKTYFALAIVALIPLCVMIVVAFGVFERTELESIERQLNILADVQKDRVVDVLDRDSSVAEEELEALLSSFSNRYKSGEMLLARSTDDGDAVFLFDRRYEEDAITSGKRISFEREELPIVRALRGEEGFFDDETDYRDVPVVAVARYIPSYDIGMVIKIDRAEAYASIFQVRGIVIPLILFSLVTVVLLGWFFGRSFSQPLVRLTEIAKQIAERKQTVDFPEEQIRKEDEFGVLTREFQHMFEEVQEYNERLEGQVQERTKELRAEKTQIESILRGMGEGVIVVDTQNAIFFVNRAASELFSLQTQSALGKRIEDVLDVYEGNAEPLSRDEWSALARKSKRSGEIHKDLFFLVNDQKRYIYVTATHIGRGKEQRGAVFVFRDVTEERELDQMKTDFISIASHQLRTPLTATGWFLEMLINGDAGTLTKDQYDYLQQAYDGNTRIIGMVNDLLNISRAESKQLKVDPQATQLESCIDEVIEQLRHSQDYERVSIEFTHPDPVLPELQLDVSLLSQVLLSVLSNAVRYSSGNENGQVKVSVRVNPDTYVIEIHDNGIGIPQDVQDRIFEKFYRADGARQLVPEGNGLGLYTARIIMRIAGGNMWFESQEGEGTTLFIEIPAGGMTAIEGDKSLAK